jgi:LysW-gamma-L-lysine carboxypeptidase
LGNFETLVGLVERYSPSGQENTAVDWLVKRMQELGFDETFADEAGNAVGLIGSGPKQIVLLGHIDTVPGEIKVEQINNLLYGRGCVDAKGPLACFVDAAAQIGAVDGWQFVVIGAVDEERNSVGARFVVDQYRPDFAIIGEPNNWDRIALGYKGSAWADVTVWREQTHTASGEQTAVEAAIEVWWAVKAFAESFNLGKQRAFDKVLPTLRKMDSSEDGFEQRAQLRIGARLPVEMAPDQWCEKLVEIVSDSHLSGDCHFSVVRVGYPVPAWECEKNSPLVRAFLHGIRQAGGTPRFVYKTGTADLNVVAPVWGCPAVVYGPGDSALDHTPNEHLSLDEYKKSVNVLVGTLRKLIES